LGEIIGAKYCLSYARFSATRSVPPRLRLKLKEDVDTIARRADELGFTRFEMRKELQDVQCELPIVQLSGH
jgi:hypothetical protein